MRSKYLATMRSSGRYCAEDLPSRMRATSFSSTSTYSALMAASASMTCCAPSTSEAQKASTAFWTMSAAPSLIREISASILAEAFSGISSVRKTASRVMESM